MPDLTARLGLEKPLPNTEFIDDGIVDINENMDKLDANPGTYICTSATRPTGFDGRRIYETDTHNTLIYRGDLGQYVSENRLRYILSDASWVNLSASASSRVVANLTTVPTEPYARKAYIHGRLSVTSGAIASGTLEVDLAVSALVGTVDEAQGRSRLLFNSTNAEKFQTAFVDCYVTIPANTTPLVRCWLKNNNGSAVTFSAAAGAFGLFGALIEAQK